MQSNDPGYEINAVASFTSTKRTSSSGISSEMLPHVTLIGPMDGITSFADLGALNPEVFAFGRMSYTPVLNPARATPVKGKLSIEGAGAYDKRSSFACAYPLVVTAEE